MSDVMRAVLLIATLAVAPVSPTPSPVDLVHPFVGTENFGNTFPGASAPFGMVQVSPDTGGQGGYDYRQTITWLGANEQENQMTVTVRPFLVPTRSINRPATVCPIE